MVAGWAHAWEAWWASFGPKPPGTTLQSETTLQETTSANVVVAQAEGVACLWATCAKAYWGRPSVLDSVEAGHEDGGISKGGAMVLLARLNSDRRLPVYVHGHGVWVFDATMGAIQQRSRDHGRRPTLHTSKQWQTIPCACDCVWLDGLAGGLGWVGLGWVGVGWVFDATMGATPNGERERGGHGLTRRSPRRHSLPIYVRGESVWVGRGGPGWVGGWG